MIALAHEPAPDLRVLREELAELRRVHPRRSSVVLEAFCRLVRAADAVGQPLDGLRRHTADEVERFFAQTIPGTSGHVYWDGTRDGFKRNDGKKRSPRRWWYAHKHGRELGPHESLVAMCGEVHCINPEHCETGRRHRDRRYSDEQMLNAVKVAALRLGRAPKSEEWQELGLSPSRGIYTVRFGSWETVIRKAGLEYVRSRKSGRPATASDCIAALRHLKRMIGHWPSRNEFDAYRELLYAADLPSSPTTIHRRLGGWPAALRKAGKR